MYHECGRTFYKGLFARQNMAKLFLRSSPQSRVLAACISTNMANQHVEHAAHFLETKLHKLFWFHIVQTAWIVGAQLYLCQRRLTALIVSETPSVIQYPCLCTNAFIVPNPFHATLVQLRLDWSGGFFAIKKAYYLHFLFCFFCPWVNTFNRPGAVPGIWPKTRFLYVFVFKTARRRYKSKKIVYCFWKIWIYVTSFLFDNYGSAKICRNCHLVFVALHIQLYIVYIYLSN